MKIAASSGRVSSASVALPDLKALGFSSALFDDQKVWVLQVLYHYDYQQMKGCNQPKHGLKMI